MSGVSLLCALLALMTKRPRGLLRVSLPTVLLVALLAACAQTSAPQTPTATPNLSTVYALTLPSINATVTALAITTSTPVYDLEPGETWHRLGTDGGPMDHEGVILIGIGYPRIVEDINEEGEPTEWWEVGLWLASDRRHGAGGRPVRVGGTVEFEGYRIRLLDIQEGWVDFAISRLSEPTSIAMPTLGLYNTEPGEALLFRPLGWDSQYGTIQFVFSHRRVEESVDESGAVTEEEVVSVRVWSEQGTAEINATMREGDVIEFEGYRIRLLEIFEETVLVALGDLSELYATPGD